MTTPPAEGMPTTRGTNFSLVEPTLAFVRAIVTRPDDLARAELHRTAMGVVAGGQVRPGGDAPAETGERAGQHSVQPRSQE